MKILFYLPVVTPWWFETIITPMLRSLYEEAELHIIVAPLWKNTGLDICHVEPLADLEAINWHIVVPDDPAQFRLDGAAVEGLLDLVRVIDPDITLARSADRATPALFPGTVRHIMEPGAGPVHAPYRWFILEEQPFHYGVMPASAQAAADHAATLMAPFWQALEAKYAQYPRDAIRRRFGLPLDRPVLAVPLQYEHEENLYGVGSPMQSGAQFLRELLDRLDERIMLAIADHPLNARFLPRGALHQLAAEFPDRVRICPAAPDGLSPTNLLIAAADALLVDRSKCVSIAAFFGIPVVHVGDSVMADWVNATTLDSLIAGDLTERALPAPDRDSARRWFGWHFGMRLTNFETVPLKTLQDRIAGHMNEAEVVEFLAIVSRWFNASLNGADKMIATFAEETDGGQIAA